MSAKPNTSANASSSTTTLERIQGDKCAESYVIVLRDKEKDDAQRKVHWAEDTVDNENLNKKKSKSCCIFSKQKSFDQSGSDSGSDSEDEVKEVEEFLYNAYDGKPKTIHSHNFKL
ncbi:uncharacterized protein LOC135146322 [Zophobas morio]|jgi:protein phosphatase 1 regulatory subunit 11|uniref:uncharacterized protein LOC135146322 n=1 Tax=Zophobas morio TaxID=2755281 RepID=UPI003082D34D